jgi:GNAT superfamily N-acetyltransferase
VTVTSEPAPAAVAIRSDLSPEALVAAILDDFRVSATRRRALPGEQVLDRPAILAGRCDVSSPDVNHVVRARFGGADEPDVDAAIDSAIGFFAGRPFLWWIGPDDEPADLADRLAARGLDFLDVVPGMAMDLAELADEHEASPPAELSIAPVLDRADLDAFHGVVTHGFPEDWTDESAVRAVMAGTATTAAETAYREPFGVPTRWLGRVDGRPVTTTRLHLGAGVAGVYTVVTVADARGRGYGTAITRRALLAARDAGLRISTLQASDAGRRIYERIGFTSYCEFRLHESHPTRETPAVETARNAGGGAVGDATKAEPAEDGR